MTSAKIRKLKQQAINQEILDNIEWYNTYNNEFNLVSVKPLRYCNAKVYHYIDDNLNYHVFLLQSYNTIVSMVKCDSFGITGYDFLRYVFGYTSTSAQHISKFFADYKAENRLRYYPVKGA